MVQVKSSAGKAAPALIGIGELAARSGVTPSALRFYERRGLVAPARRESGRRRYTDDAVRRVRLLVGAQRVGFSLEEIRTLLDGYDEARPAPAEWRALAERKLAELDDAIRTAKAMQGTLRHAMECRCRTLGECTLVTRGRGSGGAPRTPHPPST